MDTLFVKLLCTTPGSISQTLPKARRTWKLSAFPKVRDGCLKKESFHLDIVQFTSQPKKNTYLNTISRTKVTFEKLLPQKQRFLVLFLPRDLYKIRPDYFGHLALCDIIFGISNNVNNFWECNFIKARQWSDSGQIKILVVVLATFSCWKGENQEWSATLSIS